MRCSLLRAAHHQSSLFAVCTVDPNSLLDKHSVPSDDYPGSSTSLTRAGRGARPAASVAYLTRVREWFWVLLLIVVLAVWRLASPSTMRSAFALDVC